MKDVMIILKTILTVAACTILLGIGTAQAAGTPQQKCQTAKLKAQGKLQACMAKQQGVELTGDTPDYATCQTKFTDALAKADAKALDAGTSCRYIDNGDSTVSDLNTGLVWEKKDDSGGIHDKDNTYTWSASGLENPTGTVFTTFLSGLNRGTSTDGKTTSGCFTGHCDWRLPTIEELRRILLSTYPCGTNPCIDATFGPTRSAIHWSMSSDDAETDSTWCVDFSNANADFYFKDTPSWARAVRGGL